MFLPKVPLCSEVQLAAGAVTRSTFFNTCPPGHHCGPQPEGSPHSKSKSQAAAVSCLMKETRAELSAWSVASAPEALEEGGEAAPLANAKSVLKLRERISTAN